MTIDEILSNVNSLSEYIAKRDLEELPDNLINMTLQMLPDSHPEIAEWEKQYQLIKNFTEKDK